MKKQHYKIRVRIWVEGGEGMPFLGTGRVVLLEKIKELGSIAHAAKSMKMSYRQAWQLVEDMNKCSNKILVEKTLGGKLGGGTKLTAEGEKLITLFHEAEENIKIFAQEESKKFQDKLL